MKQNKPIKLVSTRNSTDFWICDSYNTRRQVDGEEFVQVYKQDTPARRVWMNINTLIKAK
jgi:hypothetical protein